MKLYFCRFPKCVKLAVEWKKALGLNVNKNIAGLICIEHFNEDDLIFVKSKNRFLLKKDAVPSIENQVKRVESDALNDENESTFQKLKSENAQLREALRAAEANIADMKKENVEQKQRFDNIVQSKNSKIKETQAKLASVRSKAFYLEATKSKLTTTIMKLKGQNVLNEKFASAMEVRVCPLIEL